MLVTAVIGMLAVGAALIVGRVTAPVEVIPANTSAEAGFARDMQAHHHQAVEMAMTVRDLTSDSEMRLLAYDIATSQSQQSGQMFGWLATWGLPQASSEPAMTWMHRPVPGKKASHAEHAAAGQASVDPTLVPEVMPGMATREQLSELRSLTGRAAERKFLELMIAHHQGGVAMAEALVERSDNPTVTALAKSIINAQQSEIELMQHLLDARQSD